MKQNVFVKLIVMVSIFIPAICFSEGKNHTYELEFGDPGAHKILQIGGNGDLNIVGYEGKKLLISANESIVEEDTEATEKTKGLKKLGGGGFNIVNDKKENSIIISRSIIGRKMDLDIKVPNNVTLRLGSGNTTPQELKNKTGKAGKNQEEKNNGRDFFTQFSSVPRNYVSPGNNGIIAGNIFIKDLAGTIEINTVRGDITAENIKGEVTASSVQGSLRIVFNTLSKNNALYFSTVNGEIDITLPGKTSADIMAKTLNGNVYSGFDGETTTENIITDQTDTTVMQNMVNTFLHPNYITSRINGGGQEIYLSTINGNIYIRKGE